MFSGLGYDGGVTFVFSLSPLAVFAIAWLDFFTYMDSKLSSVEDKSANSTLAGYSTEAWNLPNGFSRTNRTLAQPVGLLGETGKKFCFYYPMVQFWLLTRRDTFISEQLGKGVPSAVVAKWCDRSDDLLKQLKARRKKFGANLADIEAVLEILENH